MVSRIRLAVNSALAVILMFTSGCATFSRLQSSGALYSAEGEPRINLLAVKQAGTTDCGVACLSGVLSYWGTHVPQEDIKKFLGKPPKGGYSLGQLKSYAEHIHFSAFILEGSYSILQHHCGLGRPCIIVITKGRKTNHSLVVFGITPKGKDFSLQVMDPANGRMKILPASEIDSKWAEKGRPLLLIGQKEGAE